jgi:hypothetical protein
MELISGFMNDYRFTLVTHGRQQEKTGISSRASRVGYNDLPFFNG